MSKEPTDEEFIAGVMETIKRLPKNKVRGDAEEMQSAIIKALHRAYGGGSRDWESADETGEVDAEMAPMGDLCMELSGLWMFDNSKLMIAVGDAVAAGIQKVIESNDPDAPEKIHRLSQVAIGAGYICALLDDKAADGRKPNAMTHGRQKASTKRAEKVRQFAAENPDMTQKDMAAALGMHRDTVGKYLNQ